MAQKWQVQGVHGAILKMSLDICLQLNVHQTPKRNVFMVLARSLLKSTSIQI